MIERAIEWTSITIDQSEESERRTIPFFSKFPNLFLFKRKWEVILIECKEGKSQFLFMHSVLRTLLKFLRKVQLNFLQEEILLLEVRDLGRVQSLMPNNG